MNSDMVRVFADRDPGHGPEVGRVERQYGPAGPVGDIKPGAVACGDDVVGPDADRGGPGFLLAVECRCSDGAAVDVERVERLAVGRERHAALEVGSRVGFPLFFLLRRLGRRLGIADASQVEPLELEAMHEVGAASRPPELLPALVEGQAVPALAYGLRVDHLRFVEIHQRELMRVVSAGGDQRVPAVGQRDDVQRQVGQLDRDARGRDGPTVGEEESPLGRAGEPRLFLGQEHPGERQGQGRQRHQGGDPRPGWNVHGVSSRGVKVKSSRAGFLMQAGRYRDRRPCGRLHDNGEFPMIPIDPRPDRRG